MNQDWVYYGVFICLAGGVLVPAYLFWMIANRANKDKQ